MGLLEVWGWPRGKFLRDLAQILCLVKWHWMIFGAVVPRRGEYL